MEKLDLKKARTGDPKEPENPYPDNVIEANDRRTIRQAIMTQLMREVADEILKSKTTLTTYDDDGKVKKPGTFEKAYRDDIKNAVFPLLRALIKDPEAAFNARRNKLGVSRPFGSINLVVFRNAMAIGDEPVDPEEVAMRVVIRSGISGKHKYDGFRGCK